MYNRYIPQPDGSFRRNRIADPPKYVPKPPDQAPRVATHCDPNPQPHPPMSTSPRKQRPCRTIPHSKREDGNVTGFIRKLLPKDFDTGDLFVVLLLLLMAGDSAEEKNTALLTLALYFLM